MSKNTYSKKHTDEDLRAMAICTLRYVSEGQDVGSEIVLTVAARMGMHPNIALNEIQRLAAIKL